jgi:flagellar M-ring protein FliF
MAEESQNLLGRFNSLSRQPVTRQLGLLLGLAASIALSMGLVQWAMAPDFTPLYGELSPSATTDIIRSLESSGVPYKLHGSTGLVSVPTDKVHEARLKLASEGLPQGSGSAGFDILYKEQEIGVSSFMEKARYDRALEQELSRSIASLDSVRSSRVHLALPKQSAFVRKKSKPAASVLLTLYPARVLADRQLAGIVHLVASSVPGLEAENVSVVDNMGKLLSSQNSNDDFAYTKEQFRFTQQLENSYTTRITEILTPILGIGSVNAQVVAEVDYTVVEKTSETYAPETTIRSEQLEEELTSGRQTSAGVPGTLANQPPVETTVSGEPGAEKEKSQKERSSKREVRNYELDKTISHIREVPGTLKKLSVAVVVDYIEQENDEGDSERVPLTEARMAEITSLVKEAVGFNEERGDSLNVLNASFVAPPEMEPMPEASLMEQAWVWRAAKIGVSAIAIILVIFTVLKPLMRASSAPPPSSQPLAPPQGQAGYAMNPMAGGMVMGDDQVTLGGQQQQMGLPGGAPVYQQQLNMARTMVEGEPERVAHVVKNWVAADG